MTIQFHLRLLGQIDLREHHHPLGRLHSRKAVALLSYLVITEQPCARTTLIGYFWPDLGKSRALNNLSWMIGHLNKFIPGCLLATRQSVRFQRSPTTELDLLDFRALIASRTPESLTAAIKLYRGPLLSDLHLDSCPDFNSWLARERLRWQGYVLDALDALIAHTHGLRDFPLALHYARQRLALDPTSESAYRRLIALLALNGQPQEGLDRYHECAAMLSERFTLVPDAETTLLYERIRDGRYAVADVGSEPLETAGAQTGQLPQSPLTPFFGREQELMLLRRYLRDHSRPLLTIVGPGGIGKTRLALALAEQQRKDFRHGYVYIPLAAVEAAEALPQAMAEALQLTLAPEQASGAQVLRFLATRQLLLILDNFEHLLAESSWLLELLSAVPHIKLVVTSRERLHLQLETIVLLQGLALPRDHTSAREASAVQLFLERARRVQFDLDPTDEILASIVAICRFVEGNPLAIELAATWGGTMSYDVLASELVKNQDLLRSDWQTLPARQRSLRAIFNHSWVRLSEEEQRSFAALAIFPAPFPFESAQYICHISLTMLKTLWDKSLIQRLKSGEYALHELLREYALDKLERSNQHEELARRHALYYLELAERAAEDELAGVIHPQFECHYVHLRAALEWSLAEREAFLLLRLSAALWWFWRARGLLPDGVRWLEKALALVEGATDAPGDQYVARCQLALGSLRRKIGLPDKAIIPLRQAYATFAAIGDTHRLAITSGILGMLYRQTGEYALAAQHFQQQMQAAREQGDRYELIMALVGLGHIASAEACYHQALAYYQESVELARHHHNQRLVWAPLLCMGAIQYYLANYPRAFDYFKQTLMLTDPLTASNERMMAIGNLGCILVEWDDAERASLCLRASLALALASGNLMHTAWSLGYLGRVALLEDTPHQAIELYDLAVKLLRMIKGRFYLAEFLYFKGRCCFAEELDELAESCLREALALAQEVGPKDWIPNMRLGLILIKLRQGRLDQAAALTAASTLLHEVPALDQGLIHYALWKIDPSREAARAAALEWYRVEATRCYPAEQRQRYQELAGAALTPLPPLPELPALIAASAQPLPALLEQLKQLASTELSR